MPGVSLIPSTVVEAFRVSKSDASPENLAFAAELIKARNELGLTQSQLSSASGVSLSAIKGYETGRNMPGARELRDLCKALHISPNKLLFGVETPFPTLSSGDPAAASGEKGQAVHRNRIVALVNMLSVDESYAIYLLAHSIAVARFGEKAVRADMELADLMTSIQLFKQNGTLEMDLLPKDSDLLRALAQGLKDAVATGKKTVIPVGAGERGLIVGKK